jgi:hypothetical protein
VLRGLRTGEPVSCAGAERYVQAGFTDIVLMPLSHGAATDLTRLLPALRSPG